MVKITIEMFEIDEQLHSAIFYKTTNWGSYLYLRKIKDYYSPNIYFNAEEVKNFQTDLESYKIFIDNKYLPKLEQLVNKLNNSYIEKIHISGD